jgi:acetate kinase
MNILVINCGSSSLKFQLFDMARQSVLAKGLVERIGGNEMGAWKYERNDNKLNGEVAAPDHDAAFGQAVALLTDPTHGAIASADEIDAVGHRVVHGGEAFFDSAIIDDAVIASVEAQSPLAPLHNPPNLAGIRAAMRFCADVPHIAVFDTAFHQAMPEHAYLYALPYELYEEHHVRRYGFHGTSHRFVARRGAEVIGKTLDQFTGITCHLGNGCSMAAISGGKSVDTSMGLTPLEGLIMGTRCGDIDPALISFLMRTLGKSADELDALLNKQSGLLGISGVSNDARALWEAADDGNERAKLALAMFAYRVKKYIGAYLAVLNGADAIIFTGGIGERDIELRKMICSDMQALGVELDLEQNQKTFGTEAIISTPASATTVLVVPTNEELEIAQETARLAKK